MMYLLLDYSIIFCPVVTLPFMSSGYSRDAFPQVGKVNSVAACGAGRRRTTGAPSTALQLAQQAECCLQLSSEEFRLFPGRKVTASVNFVPVDEFAASL
jgi:hypothetical protein